MFNSIVVLLGNPACKRRSSSITKSPILITSTWLPGTISSIASSMTMLIALTSVAFKSSSLILSRENLTLVVVWTIPGSVPIVGAGALVTFALGALVALVFLLGPFFFIGFFFFFKITFFASLGLLVNFCFFGTCFCFLAGSLLVSGAFGLGTFFSDFIFFFVTIVSIEEGAADIDGIADGFDVSTGSDVCAFSFGPLLGSFFVVFERDRPALLCWCPLPAAFTIDD